MKDVPVFSSVPLLTAADAKEADRHTIEDIGVPGFALMDHAARAVAERAAALAQGRPIVVLAGPGNNGGDGWACARHLQCWGHGPVTVLSTNDPDALRGDAKIAAETYLATAGAYGRFEAGAPAAQVIDRAAALSNVLDVLEPGLIIDALFGTGLNRPLDEFSSALVEIINARSEPVLAVDLPSGLVADGGAPAGACIAATETMTFGGFKVAHVADPGAGFCGTVSDVDLSLVTVDLPQPRHFLAGKKFVHDGAWRRIVDARLNLEYPSQKYPSQKYPSQKYPSQKYPSIGAHKGKYGHVAILEGAPATRGAAQLAALSALRAGAGMVTLLVDDDRAHGAPEIMRRQLQEGSTPSLSGIQALVVGPGLSNAEHHLARARAVLAEAARRNIPIVVDAEAVMLLKAGFSGLGAVATPHPGEAARLLDLTSGAVQADRLQALQQLQAMQDECSVTFVLKGAAPMVGMQDGRVAYISGHCSTLAIAGSGDVLAGVIGALLARGHGFEDAAIAGCLLHQRAGAHLQTIRARGWLASELADAIAVAIDLELCPKQP